MYFLRSLVLILVLASVFSHESSKNPLKKALAKHYENLVSSAKSGKQYSKLQSIVPPEATMPFIEYMAYFNYPVESHRVTTEDGYILTIFRIQRKYSQIISGLPVVFLQHGLLDCAEGWIVNEESKAPAFVLANLGYDVWLGNVRGNKYSREHVSYDPDKDDAFWQFSYDEMAKYDLPAYFEYVSKVTGKDQIDYIGHSQGTIIMFAALSDGNPVVKKYLRKYIAVGPVAHVYHQTSTIMELLADSRMQYLLDIFDVNEFLPHNWMITNFGSAFCAIFGKICDDFVSLLADMDPNVDNYDRYDVLAGHDPSGTSVKNMVHWEQGIYADVFQKYDYGTEENIKIYGQPTPPPYNLGNITHNVYLFAGQEDKLADPVDVQRLKDELVNAKVKFYNYPSMGHITFLLGIDMSYLNDVILALKE